MSYWIVFFGAGIGGAARHGVNALALRMGWTDFPFGTLAINVIGSLLMGVIVEYFALRSHLSQPLRLFLTTGVIGGFTTFSAFSLEIALLHERGRTLAAGAYALSSVVLSVGALFAAMVLVRLLLKAGS